MITTPPQHPDLRNDPIGWHDLTGPSGRQPLGVLVSAVAEDIDELTDRAVARIVSNVDEYARVDPTHRGDLWWSTRRNLQAILVCVAQQRPFTSGELAARRAVGARAVDTNMPIAAVMRGFRLGYVELWETATTTAEELGPDAWTALLANAGMMWVSLDQLSSAITEAYRRAVAAQELQERRRALGFVADLRELPASAPDVERLAGDLGLDPTGGFLWAVFRGHADSLERVATLVVDTAESSLALLAGSDLGPDDESRFGAELSQRGARNVGIGTTRSNLDGAGRSLLEAERAHRTAAMRDHGVVRYRDEWLSCLLVDAASGLGELLAPVLEALEDDDMAATVAAYLDANGTLAAAGQALAVHPNTVAYRLERLAQRTGLDVRTSRGVVEATAALVLHEVQRAAADRW